MRPLGASPPRSSAPAICDPSSRRYRLLESIVLKIPAGALDLPLNNCIMTQMSKSSASPTRPPAPETPLAACCSEPLEQILPAGLFRALGDPNRLALLARLAVCGRAATVTEIACCLPIDLSVVSRHLRRLREAGVLDCERRGKEVYYIVRYDTLASTLRHIADAIDACCPHGACGPKCSAATMPRRPVTARSSPARGRKTTPTSSPTRPSTRRSRS